MDPKFPPFLDEAQIADLQLLVRQGYATAQMLQDRPAIVQVRRYNTTTGKYEDFGDPVHLISISFGIREVKTEGGTPIVSEHSAGDFKCWEEDYEPMVTDRFLREGMVCEVTTVYPPEFGVRVAEISLKQITPR